jgi:hypothetical protein
VLWVSVADRSRHLVRVTGSTLLMSISIVWVVICAVVGAFFLRRAPAVSLAMFGAVLGAVGGFLVGNADGPAEVPACTAVGASLGLFINGGLGMLATSPRPPSQPLRRAGWVVLMAEPIVAGVMTVLLQVACPLYVTGKGTGFCNYQEVDLLGGWVSGVTVAFLFDTWFVVGLLLLSAWQARRLEDATDPKWRHLAARAGRETRLSD